MLSRAARILKLAKSYKQEPIHEDESNEKENRDPYVFNENDNLRIDQLCIENNFKPMEKIKEIQNGDPYDSENDSRSQTMYISPSRSSECGSFNLQIDKQTTEEFKNCKLSETSILKSTEIDTTINLQFTEISPEICLQKKIEYYLQSIPSSTQNDSNKDVSNLNNIDGDQVKRVCRDIFKDNFSERQSIGNDKDILIQSGQSRYSSEKLPDSMNNFSPSNSESLSSGSEYLPSDDNFALENASEINSNSSTSSEISLKSPITENKDEDYTSLLEVGNTKLESTYNNYKSANISRNSSSMNKTTSSVKDFCPFCFEEVGHFSRHLFRKHSDEEAVRKVAKMPLKDSDRRTAIIALRKKGNFILHQERNEIKPVRKPLSCFNTGFKNSNSNNICEQYFPCVHCLGYYKKSYLWRHKKICKSTCIDKTDNSKKQHLTEAQTFLAVTGLHGNYLNKNRIKKDVFTIMRPDKISFTAKTDSLICLYGESFLNKHKRKQMNVVVSNHMRELARLKIALQDSTTIVNLIDILKPEMYNYIIASTKVISGYDAESQTFKASSLALHLGTNLKFLCDVAKKAIIIKDPLFPILSDTERDAKLKNISELRDMIVSHWNNDIASLANKVLNEIKVNKPKLLPVTEDVQAFKNVIMNLADKAFNELKEGNEISHNYKTLAECTLCLVLVFNRKRIGEVQFLDIETYEKNFSNINQEECLSSLSELEKIMSTNFKRVIVFGKGSKPVPILFTKRMQKFIDILLTIRKTTNIVPQSNKYIFANPGSKDRWMNGAAVLRKFAHHSGIKNPSLLTSTRCRKQISTILQLISFEKGEMEQIARFMGHTEKTHMEFYRLTEDVYQTAKVAKVLMLLNAGRGTEFKGKSLSEIEVGQDIIDDDDNDKMERSNVNIEDKVERSIEYNHEKMETSNENNQLYQFKPNPNESGPSSSNRSLNSKKDRRIRWSQKEKKIVLDFFKRHVKNRLAPKKSECLILIKQHPNIFADTDWVRIKTLVYNTYRST